MDGGQGFGRNRPLRQGGPIEAMAAAPGLAELEERVARRAEDVAVDEFDGNVEAVAEEAAAGDPVGAEEEGAVALGPGDDAVHFLSDGVLRFLGQRLPIVRIE